MGWMFLPLRRYADFQGRSRRLEYWMFTLGLIIFALLLMVPLLLSGYSISQDASAGRGASSGLLLTMGLFYLAIIIPSIAVQVRRFHDQDRSGWFILLGLVPYIGGLILLVFMCLEGTRGPNRFGPDPKRPDEDLDSMFS